MVSVPEEGLGEGEMREQGTEGEKLKATEEPREREGRRDTGA